MTDTFETLVEKTRSMFADAGERTRAAMEKSGKAFGELNEFQRGNLEAMVASSQIAAKGAQDIARHGADYAKGAVEKGNANVRRLAAATSPTEFFQLQTEIAREAIDAAVADTAKFTETCLKLMGEVAKPYQNRVALAAEKLTAAAA